MSAKLLQQKNSYDNKTVYACESSFMADFSNTKTPIGNSILLAVKGDRNRDKKWQHNDNTAEKTEVKKDKWQG